MLKVYFNRVPCLYWASNAIYSRHIIQFWLERSKEFIPENKYLCIVLVNVFGVDGMMHPVMRWGHNYLFQEAHFFYMLCMIPKLCKQMQWCNNGNNFCRHSQ